MVDPAEPLVRMGRYELDRVIGCGGMGIVFLAHDLELDRPVALKLWNLETSQAELALRNEALCQAQISHPNVVHIYETGRFDDHTYLVMEYVDGMDLRRWLRRHVLLWQEVLALFIGAGQGLAAVHAGKLVHGDFKPENVLLSADGSRVLVADFGLARAIGEFEDHDDEWHSGGGTLAYMAPERLQGRLGNAWSDQFSFCVSLWECLHGVRPFAGETPSELLAYMRAEKVQAGPLAVFVPALLRKVLRKGLALDPSDRYESMKELVGELYSVPTRVLRQKRRRLLGGLTVVGVGAWVMLKREPMMSSVTADAIAHARGGINSGLTTTRPEQPSEGGEELAPPGEIFELIEREKFEEAMRLWKAHRYRAWSRGAPTAPLSLKVAQRFLDSAQALQNTKPEAARIAARCADQVGTSVTLDNSGGHDHATAEEISATAFELSLDLARRLDETKPD